MRAILTFNLPRERSEYKICNSSMDFYIALLDIQNRLRDFRKHDQRKTIPIDEIEKMFFNVLEENNIEDLYNYD